ncbi:hypothetical protein Tco_0952145 [Tanacetum coccineum]|uniref:Uncharacterized protein n=1 Tax=Tanacetum coccineum TaxID=301880 RepID=A0ABQ5DW63_9ASTR
MNPSNSSPLTSFTIEFPHVTWSLCCDGGGGGVDVGIGVGVVDGIGGGGGVDVGIGVGVVDGIGGGGGVDVGIGVGVVDGIGGGGGVDCCTGGEPFIALFKCASTSKQLPHSFVRQLGLHGSDVSFDSTRSNFLELSPGYILVLRDEDAFLIWLDIVDLKKDVRFTRESFEIVLHQSFKSSQQDLFVVPKMISSTYIEPTCYPFLFYSMNKSLSMVLPLLLSCLFWNVDKVAYQSSRAWCNPYKGFKPPY